MKNVLTILALSAACSLAACQSTNDPNAFTGPNANHDANGNIVDGSSAYNLHNSTGSDKLPTVTILPEDRAFIVDASAAGNYEVEAGKLALTNSSDQHIKDMAQHMIDDHTKANGQLMLLAKEHNVLLSAATNIDQQNMLNKLRPLNGTDFDREYITQQQAAHRDAIAKFETEANDSQTYDVREFAANTLPTLREHLKMLTGDSMNRVGMAQ